VFTFTAKLGTQRPQWHGCSVTRPTLDAVLLAVHRYGYNVTAFQVLEPGFCYWFAPETDGVVAYVDTGSAWVAAGAPLCPDDQLAAVALQFEAAAAESGRRVCFAATEERFVRAAAPLGVQGIQIGEQPIWDPQRWPEIAQKSRSLREQLRRARAKGVTVRLLAPRDLEHPEAPLRTQVERLFAAWLGARHMAPLGFLVQLHVFTHVAERRCFVALQDGQLVGFLGMIPVYGRDGWFIEDFLREPSAPNGTSELMIDGAMQAAREEGAGFVTLGLSPLSGAVEPMLRWIARLGSTLYDFEGLRAFKAKLKPERWDPVYLAYGPRSQSWLALYDVLNAFARGNMLRFGLETVLRGPAVVVRLLAVLLVPWTLLLMATDARWFPTPSIKWAWVAYDVLVTLALFRLSARYSRRLGTAAACAVSLDALLTWIEAALYNWPRATRLLDAVVIVLAMLAPSLAALILWRARKRHQIVLRA
jgi:phosphatidylglycerol lysyltransferase